MKNKVKAFYLTDKVIKALEKKSKEDDRSMSWMVNKILEKELQI